MGQNDSRFNYWWGGETSLTIKVSHSLIISGTHLVPVVVIGAAVIYWVVGLMCLLDFISLA